MLSVMHITCPHCGSKGQVMVPPQGAIVIGPCPECSEFVCVFCGSALPLERDILLHGSSGDKRAHLMGVLSDFLEERVTDLIDQVSASMEEMDGQGAPGPEVFQAASTQDPEVDDMEISSQEFQDFVERELPQLDNADYFRAIFS
jgi:hypothetical protein